MTNAASNLLVLMLLMVSCVEKENGNRNVVPQIKSVRVCSLIEAVESKSLKIQNIKDSISIYRIGDVFIYEFPVMQYLTVLNEHSNGIITDSVTEIVKRKYLVFHKDSSKGRFADSATATDLKFVGIDSLKNRYAIFHLGNIYDSLNDVLVQRSSYPGEIVLEKLVPKRKPDASYNDTTFLWFEKQGTHDLFSFDTELDVLKKMHLYKIEFFYSSFINPAGNLVPERAHKFEIKKNENFDPGLINSIYSTYIKENPFPENKRRK